MQTKVIAKLTLRFLARWRLAYLTAQLWHWVTRPLSRKVGAPRSGKRPYRVLALNTNKSGLLQDLEESLLKSDEFELVSWPSYALKSISAEILSPLLHDANYVTDSPKIEASKIEYRAFLQKAWKIFNAETPIDVVISANFAYCAQREFGAALQEVGTPFIVFQKENLNGMSPERWRHWHKVYKERRGRFKGRKILVYNDIERELEIESGVALPREVVVTGMSRLDRIHRWRIENAGRPNGNSGPKILFFAFAPKDKLPVRRKPTATMLSEADLAGLTWQHLCEGTHRAIVELARKRPDFSVTVKTKGLSRQQAEIEAMLGDDLPPNLTIVSGGDPFAQLIESHVVVGFNTTALLEAMAAGKPVVVPWFNEARDEAMKGHMIDLGDAVAYAHSTGELIEMVCRQAVSRDQTPSQLAPETARALKKWIGNDDGAAGRRVVDAVLGELNGSKTPVGSVTSR